MSCMMDTKQDEASSLIEKAKVFATQAHASIDQKRKYTGEPYIVHPESVAGIVAEVTDDAAMIAAAWLHDVVEDTPVTIETIQAEFGEDVAGLVADLTDVSQPEDGNRKVRKAIDREHTANASARAKTVKLADLIDNTSSITAHDEHFAKVYMSEKRLLLNVLRDGDKTLHKRAQKLLKAYYKGRQQSA
jgi:(p)ppGpp synthase/HD superfamily hydrolase